MPDGRDMLVRTTLLLFAVLITYCILLLIPYEILAITLALAITSLVDFLVKRKF